MRKSIFVFLFMLTYSVVFPQELSIIKKFKNLTGSSTSDLLNEFKKQNFSEEDLRSFAQLYGINYDEFVARYLNKNSPLPIVQPDTVLQKSTEIPKMEKTEIVSPSGGIEKDQNSSIIQESKGNDEFEKYFGYSLFRKTPSAFLPVEIGPIDPGYIIGPGDVLRLYLWGDVELQYELTVDQQGNIFIPTAGQIFVSGITFADLQSRMTNYLSKFYSGLISEPPKIFLDISLTKLKPVKIFVLGEVREPGGYNISSFATVFNALYAIGGPLTSGSLREISVIRDKKIIAKVDLYDYLLKGELSSDIRLQNNDVIFIPPRIKSVEIEGEINRPFIYELKNAEGLKELISYAGGFKPTAYTDRIQINRIIPFSQRELYNPAKKIIDVNFKSNINSPDQTIELFDGDKVSVFRIDDRLENYITLEGSVNRPGKYALESNPTISGLVKQANGLTPYAFTSRADIIRTLPDSSFEFITFNLEDALKDNSTQNVKLMPKDLVRIYSKFDFVDKQFVSIGGFVKEPVTLPYASNLTLLDLLIKSGGLDDPIRKGSTFLQRADIIRINPDGISSSIIKFNLDSVYYKRISNISLAPGDKVILYKANVNQVIDEYVSIEGEVFHPGKFKLNKNMTVMDLVLQAGGFTEEAFKKEVYLNRVFIDQSGKEIISESKKIPLSGSFSLNEKSKPDEFLMHRDIVVVRKDPGLEKQRIVKINGEITFPGVYVLKQRNETVLDLLKEAGGPTSEAFLYGSHFYRGGKRIIVDLESLYRDNDKSANVFLQHQDSIFVPKKPNTILVSGEVNNPGLFKFIPGKSMWDYIDNAGGLSDSADFAVFSLPNGISQRVSLGWFGSNPDVLDGAIINIKKLPPSDPNDKFDWAATIKDIFAIAASVFTILVLVNKL